MWVYSTCSGLETCSDWWKAGKWCCTCSQHWPQESLQSLLFLGTLHNHCENQPGGWETREKRVQSPAEAVLDQQPASWPPQMWACPAKLSRPAEPTWSWPQMHETSWDQNCAWFHPLVGNDKYVLFINLFLAALTLGCGTPGLLGLMRSLSVAALGLSSHGTWAQ